MAIADVLQYWRCEYHRLIEAERRREIGQHRVCKQLTQCASSQACGPKPRYQPSGEQAVTPETEKVAIASDSLDAEQLRPQCCQRAFNFTLRRMSTLLGCLRLLREQL